MFPGVLEFLDKPAAAIAECKKLRCCELKEMEILLTSGRYAFVKAQPKLFIVSRQRRMRVGDILKRRAAAELLR